MKKPTCKVLLLLSAVAILLSSSTTLGVPHSTSPSQSVSLSLSSASSSSSSSSSASSSSSSSLSTSNEKSAVQEQEEQQQDEVLSARRHLHDIRVLNDGASGFITEPGELTEIQNRNNLPISEQTKLDTIVRSLLHLPQEELTRLSSTIDLSQPIIEGTLEAEKLLLAWKQRQEELQQAMKALMKPAEFMASLMHKLLQDQNNNKHQPIQFQISQQQQQQQQQQEEQSFVFKTLPKEDNKNQNDNNSLTIAQKVEIFEELESLLADIDNARDFHTIGAFPILASYLHPSQPMEIRSVATWCIGTMIKNSYDYQLYLLETLRFEEHKLQEKRTYDTNVLQLLMSAFEASAEYLTTTHEETNVNHTVDVDEEKAFSDNHELLKKVLYALSSAVRGNIDIQESLLASTTAQGPINGEVSVFHNTVLQLLTAPTTIPVDITRKIWSLLSDLLDERADIHSELVKHLLLLEIQQRENNSTELSRQIESLLSAKSDLNLLGDAIVDSNSSIGRVYETVIGDSIARHVRGFVQLQQDDQANVVQLAAVESTLRSLLAIIQHLLKQPVSVAFSSTSRSELSALRKELIRLEVVDRYEDLFKMVNEALVQLE